MGSSNYNISPEEAAFQAAAQMERFRLSGMILANAIELYSSDLRKLNDYALSDEARERVLDLLNIVKGYVIKTTDFPDTASMVPPKRE